MATIISLDPRVTRAHIDPDRPDPLEPKHELDQFHTYEVFHQQKSGGRHVHVGSLHAPTKELALLMAKEQYARRGQTLNLWVVNTRDVVTMPSEDSEIFETTPEKKYRDVSAYMVRNKVEEFKKEQQGTKS